MAWNEPGKGGGKDPWNKGGKDPGDDVEAFLNRLKGNLGRVFGGGGPPSRDGGGGGNGLGGILPIVGVLLAIWIAFDSFVLIDERQRGVVLRFGKVERLMEPGPNFKWPRPIESVTKVAVTDMRTISDQVRLLTRDENIVQIEFNVQYNIGDPVFYLYGTREPDDTLRQAAESAIRDVIGSNEMDAVLTGERAALAAEAKSRLQTTLDSYRTGVLVSVVNISNARPPQEVRQAFDDAISAREDKERIENEARAYASRIVPEARGDAARIRTEAEGHRDAAIARATGDAERFSLLVEEYRKAPEVTRRRLYLEAMEEVLANNRKIYAGDGGNVLYLPMGQGAADAPLSRLPAATSALPPITSSAARGDDSRSTATGLRPARPAGREEIRR